MFDITQSWQDTYPAAAVGVLAMEGLKNPERHAALDERKAALEADLRARYGGLDRAVLKSLPVFAAYAEYYKGFKKSYHVQGQIESIVWKGRSIPAVAALVEAMFMAELDSGLLTAGHDLALVESPVRIAVAAGSEVYRRLDGGEQVLKAGDMYIADRQGVLSSILYGPDERTAIRPETERALFTVYAPAGIDPAAVRRHLEQIRDHARLVTPAAQATLLHVHTA